MEATGQNEIAVKTESGSTRVVIGKKATIRQLEPGTMADLKAGMAVIVVGVTGSDGTISASLIRAAEGLSAPGGSR